MEVLSVSFGTLQKAVLKGVPLWRRCAGFEGFEGAKQQFRNPTKQKPEGQGIQERAANAGGKGYLSEGAAQGLKVLKVPNSSFGTLQKAKARRPREPGASS